MTEAAPEAEAAAAPAPKADPETLVLRARPRPVVRFRRGVIVGAALLGSTAVAGIAWLGLKPIHLAPGTLTEAGADPQPRNAEDALGKAPKSYGDIPKLGPPLPGDLGKPILDHQRSLAEPMAPIDQDAAQAAQAIEAERQRVAAERKAAREAGVMVATNHAQAGPDPMAPAAAPVPASPGSAPAGQGGKLAFLERRAGDEVVDPGRLQPAAASTVLSAGSVIAASLITGLNSDLPGFVIAQVSQPVFDSPTGRTLLIPQGARLLGRYDSVVAFGQTRALVVWQRILMPDGSSISVDNLPATDTQGYAGLADKLDLHSWQLLKGVGLSTLLGVGTQLSLGNDESDLVRAIRESAQQGGARAGDRLVERALDVQPTIRVRPGWPLRVILHKDLLLPAWTGTRP
ncbi:type IV secretion system protein VirB10 [Sphingomonas kyeonggiensis]|uniref:Type IV secretion system protein VirB10 n=1 Tax=Sphingomonas kyeonggiensis TaxID=1268553 RepID=A0A7W7NUZ1_9SPHN|nr:TrbI/VirB10 family protein [Sphingomonas kyeonggiensis]MBB4841339.1 type IV secretion system protein VirB10 [Sphingomonas kyeonggiensis]